MSKPIVWTIAGSDSGSGAGIQADLLTFHDLNTHGCTVITALTAQNSHAVTKVEVPSDSFLQAQIDTLMSDLPPQAIKLGMLANKNVMQTLKPFLENLNKPIVCDPVMISTSGHALLEQENCDYFIKHIIPCATVLTPNKLEAEYLLNHKIHSSSDIEKSANELLKYGAQSVLLKGGHTENDFAQDYWTDGKHSCWITQYRHQHIHNHGSGCTLSAAITAALASGYDLENSLVIAKAYVSRGIRLAKPIGKGPGPVIHAAWPTTAEDYPWLTKTAVAGVERTQFPALIQPIGFYPIVPNIEWLKKLLDLGVTTIQLRMKDKTGEALAKEIKDAVTLAKSYQAQLFINDFWELALEFGAYGVHLGQEDLETANIKALAEQGLRLGISTHSYAELANAHAYRPSYIALGPIYPTTSKTMAFGPQGLARLQEWRQLSEYPVVAIGGITLERAHAVKATGVDGIAVISAITEAEDLKASVKAWQELMKP
ncbi:MAG: bifunctional hydroxymethylpyrimidine kinase/phosphomethylpyrimidine kinase [Proteobacteria bacterium]|nr:bifunctional hydroxymethylpyrimidine kinase/phosphomethylpyrimidine kinase [Pseudomonadota bacterium]